MHKKHIFLRVFSKITIFACVFCVFFILPVFATLPTGYTELEYIESTGKQSIVLPTISNKTTIDITAEIQQTSGTNEQIFFGSDKTQQLYTIDENWRCWKSGIKSINLVSTANKHTFVIKTTSTGVKYFIDGVENINVPSNWFSSFGLVDIPYRIFARSAGDFFWKGRVYSFKIDADAEAFLNFVPTRRNSDGEIGMYDTVSNTFFTNQGTGDFIAGPIAHCKTVSTDGVMCAACKSGYKLNSNGVCVGVIEIATTKMVDDEFAQAEANLAATVQTIESVVSHTIAQTGQIQVLQDTKQTRPDESCPANMKCLLVQDEDGTPHWYPIIEP